MGQTALSFERRPVAELKRAVMEVASISTPPAPPHTASVAPLP